jgi:guanine deaminase
MAPAPPVTLFYGTFVDLPRTESGSKHELSIRHGALWVSTRTGRIAGSDWSITSEAQLQSLIRRNAWPGTVRIIRAREDLNEFFFPGFIDTHIHAPQYPNSGLFGSSTLLDWLETYTFPLESSLGNLSKARTAYDKVISRTLANGTTYASYFATIHVGATNLLATLAHTRGQRALIGRVCMDNPSFCPSYYTDGSAQESLSATKENIAHIHSLDPAGKLVKPILTPRFAPTCSPESLSSLGALAASHSPPLHIQTHISENKDEVSLVQSLFPDSESYADVYDKHALLTKRTILAHAVHLTQTEMDLIASRDAKVSHCPASNSALGSGIAPVRQLLESGVTVGLGTDVSGGYSPSILEAARQACLVSRLLRHTQQQNPSEGKEVKDGHEVLSVEEALYLATRGGAAVVDMANDLGGFEEGMLFDAQLIRLGGVVRSSPSSELKSGSSFGSASVEKNDSVVDIFGWESWTERVHKWVWTGNDRNVRAVWVGGALVHCLDDEFRADSGSESLFGSLGGRLGGSDWLKYIASGVGVGALGWVLGRRR